ncbi:MAG: 30S ribosomal protein S17 [Candidatus Diapherotrites archaeon]|uniref:30S ribosomal protein S17 n=1 Tax=Candidatus Iainarchaeum sp. TaxID=3101447 RepID=A0A8T4C7A5_9ARCH|nr:30S ribosomal protein S17 [Candidatus Diapherotrites archaeon]
MPKNTKTSTVHQPEYPVRGNEFVGRVVSAKAPKTVTVMREIVVYNSKFERYKKVRSKVRAHNPDYINAKENDIVKIGETRKISKTKAFIVTEIVGHSRSDVVHEEMNQETKHAQLKEKNKSEETA